MTLRAAVAFCLLISAASAQQPQSLTKSDKQEAVKTIGTLLTDNYVFPDVAKQCAAHLEKKLSKGAFDAFTEPEPFAGALTKELQSVSHDKHMRVRPAPQRQGPAARRNPILDEFMMRQANAEGNYGVARAEVLEGNIGLLDIRFFPGTEEARPTVNAAMKILENVDALIVDLRKNGGGNPDLIRYYCSYFFAEKTHLNSLYWRKGDRTEEFWTLESVDGKKRPELPIFILTSNRTFSGGEEFAYNFKTRKRATLIGETTGGGANPGGMFPINPALGIFIPTGRAINPITKTNWEGTGVEPDISVSAEKALETALPKAKAAAEEHVRSQRTKVERQLEPITKALDEGEKLADAGKSKEAEQKIFPALESAVKGGYVGEMSVNMMGYNYLGDQKTDMAIAVFSFNVKQFPKSSNVYDSLGEALMKAGRNKEAIWNYRKSIELDPANDNAREMIKKMEGGK